MASRKDKDRQVSRYMRGTDRELQRRDNDRAARARRGEGRGGGRRRVRLHQEDDLDELASFEKVTSRHASMPLAPKGEADAVCTVSGVQAMRVEVMHEDGAVEPVQRAAGITDLVVGDRVGIDTSDGAPRIVHVEPRVTELARRDPGNPHRNKVIAANVEVAVVVAAIVDPPLRPGLLERFRLALHRSGIRAVVALNKLDRADAEARGRAASVVARMRAEDVACHLVSAVDGAGVGDLRREIADATTVFVGHSGVGKSSLLNALDPDGARAVGDVREFDGRGRHTTTGSSLRVLPNGARVIDTPGVREFALGPVTVEELHAAFPEIAERAAACRFRDCRHVDEPDCAVRAAATDGRIEAGRVARFVRMRDDGDA